MLILLMQTAAQSSPTPIPVLASPITLAAGWVALGFLGLMGLAILYYVFTQRIDLSGLISEPSGEASMSRFQLLIFTFVIAASLFLIVATNIRFPDPIPDGILILLGISSSSYLVSKGIQASSPQGLAGPHPQITIKAGTASATVGGSPIQFQVDVVGLANEAVEWSIDPLKGAGEVNKETGLYKPPAATDPDLRRGKVTIKATSVEDVSLTDIRNINLV